MNNDLGRLLFTAQGELKRCEGCLQKGSPKRMTGSELGVIAQVFQAAEPYAAPYLKRTVEFYMTLDTSRRQVSIDRIVRDLERLVEQLTWSYRTGGSAGGGSYTFSLTELEPQQAQRPRSL